MKKRRAAILRQLHNFNDESIFRTGRSIERKSHRMHAAAFQILRTAAQRPISRRACRIIACTRHPLPRRNFHRSAISYRIPEEPTSPESGRYGELSEKHDVGLNDAERKEEVDKSSGAQKEDGVSARSRDALGLDDANAGNGDKLSLQQQKEAQDQGELLEESAQATDVDLPFPQTKTGRARYGSGGRVRLNRSRAPEGLPPVIIPKGFFKKNVICSGEHVLEPTLAVYSGGNDSDGDNENAAHFEDLTDCDLPATQSTKYNIDVNVYREVVSATRSGLSLQPPRNIPSTSIPRPFLHLQCPKEDGTLYLDSIVETVAQKLNADLVRLDADDLAEIVGTYIDENIAWTWSKIATLGFDAHRMVGKLEDHEGDMRAADEAADAEPEDDNPVVRAMMPILSKMNRLRKHSTSTGSPFALLTPLFAGANRSRPSTSTTSERTPAFEMFAAPGDSNPSQLVKQEQWSDLKVSAVVDALIGAADAKRKMLSTEGTDGAAQEATHPPRGIIVQVKDFKLLNALPDGWHILRKLRDAINKRWFDGRSVLMLGTTATDEIDPAFSKAEIQNLQSDVKEGETRTIFIPPSRKPEQDVVFASDEKARIRDINIRHTEDMILKLGGGNLEPSLTVNLEYGIDTATAFSSDLEEQVWSYPRVYRLAATIIGLNPSISNIDGSTFTQAYKLLEASDEAKFAWGAAELKEEDDVEAVLQESTDPAKIFRDKIKKIRSDATAHEKKLLGGVVSPGEIQTTFSDVHAPKETVEALKTLTSLSLIRPEAFSYGVLATDKIPGLLLYGPPGTGKTLLAKAVAKESGATVLEVSGAEVSDMYVGEGEKNVKAIFSLAKKLSPCVVFIDEADSLLGSRSSESSKRTTHREIINQFLREWDGLKDLGAFIMVATNRPFDLDDAVLRRLPRRLLVDLPVEKDREAILRIHLKDEVLDESVSLASLAKETPFYSGSDLKNVAVSAAMACIREENEAASKHTGDEPYVYPPKRILTRQHFTKGLDEISASISEDMGTLNAIRKFDEKYGDRKGRRKKISSLGFGGTTNPEKDSEAARVRKIEA